MLSLILRKRVDTARTSTSAWCCQSAANDDACATPTNHPNEDLDGLDGDSDCCSSLVRCHADCVSDHSPICDGDIGCDCAGSLAVFVLAD